MREFKFLNLHSCDELSKMKPSDSSAFLSDLDNYYLTLRKSLKLDKNLTFGLEMEFENVINPNLLREDIYNASLVYDGWFVDDDVTLQDGKEIISPILKDGEGAWYDVNYICSLATLYGKEGNNSAGHVHIGSQVLGKDVDSWYNFVKLWCAYEDIICRFSYNEYLNKMPGIRYCEPKAHEFNKICNGAKRKRIKNRDSFVELFSISRAQSINFQNVKSVDSHDEVKNTIEFRCPNGTLNPIIWQNNVNVFAKLLMYASSKDFNEKIVNRRIMINRQKEYSSYNDIFLEEALEFCDLIFDNNLDKIYFLRQYLKNNESSRKRELVRARNFTKSSYY